MAFALPASAATPFLTAATGTAPIGAAGIIKSAYTIPKAEARWINQDAHLTVEDLPAAPAAVYQEAITALCSFIHVCLEQLNIENDPGTTLTGAVVIPKAEGYSELDVLTFNIGDSRTTLYRKTSDSVCLLVEQTSSHSIGTDLINTATFKTVLLPGGRDRATVLKISGIKSLGYFRSGSGNSLWDISGVTEKALLKNTGLRPYLEKDERHLAMTRSLGDTAFSLVRDPEFTLTSIDLATGPYIVVAASDGLGDIEDHTKQRFTNTGDIAGWPQAACEWVVTAEEGAAGDDITVSVIGLPQSAALTKPCATMVMDGHGDFGHIASSLTRSLFEQWLPFWVKHFSHTTSPAETLSFETAKNWFASYALLPSLKKEEFSAWMTKLLANEARLPAPLFKALLIQAQAKIDGLMIQPTSDFYLRFKNRNPAWRSPATTIMGRSIPVSGTFNRAYLTLVAKIAELEASLGSASHHASHAGTGTAAASIGEGGGAGAGARTSAAGGAGARPTAEFGQSMLLGRA